MDWNRWIGYFAVGLVVAIIMNLVTKTQYPPNATVEIPFFFLGEVLFFMIIVGIPVVSICYRIIQKFKRAKSNKR